MHISTLVVFATALTLFFAFVINNINYIFDVLNIDSIKLNQTKSFVQMRNNQLTNIDLKDLEIN